MRYYKLGYMDKYPIEAAGSSVENNPMYRVTFKRPIDPIKLEVSINKALEYHPLFKTKVGFDKEYFLMTNDNPLVILNVKEEERPNTFGKNTNDYPWRVSYFDSKLCFEWLHGVSDGVGALNFLREILLIYFDQEPEKPKENVFDGLDTYFEKKQKGINFEIDPKGFSFKKFKKLDRGYKTDCHVLRCPTKEVLDLSKVCKSSVAPIITVLFSEAIRKHLPEKMKNKNIACNVVLDLRRPLNCDTMHNCVDYKRVTYIDEYSKMNFKQVARIYKEKLDNARVYENVQRAITSRINDFNLYHFIKTKKWLKFVTRIVGVVMKDDDCNFVFTYPGKIDLPDAVIEKIDNIDFKVWHDFGECIMSAVDYNGMFNLNISENFKEKGIVEDFIEMGKKLGLHFEEVECSVYEQSTFVE